MLYEALAGVLPFLGHDIEMLQRSSAAAPPPPTARRADADPVLAALAMRLLARDPRDRPTSAEVLASWSATRSR